MYRILIVEDDLTIAKIIKDTLCKWDFEAEIVSDFRNVVEEKCPSVPTACFPTKR
jgi:two-component system response regulator protein BraR/BceR